MGKTSRRPGRNKPKRSEREMRLSRLNLPFPLDGPDAPRGRPRDNREFADFCLKNFLYFESDKQNEMRLILLDSYVDLLQSEDGVWNSRDVRAMHKIAGDEDELTYIRVEALNAVAYHYMTKMDMEETTTCYEKIVKLCVNATQLEKGRQLPGGRSVGEYLFELQLTTESRLHRVFNRSTVTAEGSANEILVPFSAGNQCDNCQKTRAELGVDSFDWCSRCAFECYCSRDCQKSAWKNGHKQLCRAKGDFRPGDQVMEIDGPVVQLVERLEREDFWVVVDMSGKNKHTVPIKELKPLRPALWYKFSDEEIREQDMVRLTQSTQEALKEMLQRRASLAAPVE